MCLEIKKTWYFLAFMLLVTCKNEAICQVLPVQPNYLQYSINLYKPITNYPAARPDDIVNGSVRAYALYVATNDATYLTQCKNNMTYIFNDWAANSANMTKYNIFFNLYQVCTAYEGLKLTNNVLPAWEPLMLNYITMFNTHAMGDNNQVYARASGLAYGIKLFPAHPQAADISTYIDNVWNQWYPNKDVDENAIHYCSIGMRDIIRMAKITNRESLLNNADVKKWVIRYRDIVNPSGSLPEVGDDYFFEQWSPWLFNFEYFAVMFNDPTLIEAAWRLFANGSKNEPEEFNELESITSQVTAMLPTSAQTNSVITRRTVRGTTNIPDKMILANSRIPGSPSINVELYGRGSHSHPNRIGAIQHYETANVPLFHNMTRHQYDARLGNIVYVSPDAAPIPLAIDNTTTNSGIAKTDVWYEQVIETKKMLAYDSIANPDARRIVDLTLRLSTANTGKDIQVIVDNFRLESADGTQTIPLEMCESLAKWTRTGNPYSLTTDRTQGDYAVNINVKTSETSFFYGFKFTGTNIVNFNASDYPILKFDWKQKVVPQNNNAQAPCVIHESTDLWFIVRMENTDFSAGNIDKEATVAGVLIDTLGKDCYGRVTLSNYRFTGSKVNSQLVRKQLLTKEGILILQDELTPDLNAVNMYAAQLWHMYSKGSSGANWFDSPGDPARSFFDPLTGGVIKKSLLVYYNSVSSRTYSSSLYNVGGMDRFSTYAKQSLVPGQTVKFVTVLVPHDNSVRAANIANSIIVDTSTPVTNISITYPEPLYIRLGVGDMWEVSRTPF